MNNKKIVFYTLSGVIKKEEELSKDNLPHINGMMSKCHMIQGEEEIGYADTEGAFDENIYDGKIHDYIYLSTWDNLNETTGELIGDIDTKYKQTYKKVKVNDIVKIEAILYSGPRWGGKLTNKFGFHKSNNNNVKELRDVEIPAFLIKKNNIKEKLYYFLTVKYENCDTNKKYNYISDDTTIKIGDRVLVNRLDELTVAKVIETGFFNKFNAPFPVDKCKKIIKKVNDNFDIEDINVYNKNKNVQPAILKMNIDDTHFEFGIFDYKPSIKDDENWATVFIKVCNEYFNYSTRGELMTSDEIEELLEQLKKLLRDEIKEEKKIDFYEPNLEFVLYPKINLWDTGKYSYIKKGYEIQDIYMELIINLINKKGEFTEQKYILPFYREEIEIIVEYINSLNK